MNKREAAIISAYTGILIGEFWVLDEYIEEIMGRSVWTHELADKDIVSQIKEKSKEDFMRVNESITD